MAKIILGVASSHGPQLEMPPENWIAYGDRGRSLNKHWYGGETYTFPELAELRAENHFEREYTEEKMATRWDACQAAIARLSDVVRAAKPDISIILGDDQQESFHDDNMPAFALYHGDTVDDAPITQGHRLQWGDAVVANRPSERLTHPTAGSFGAYLIEALTASEFDVTRTNKLPEGRGDGAIGHAFYYVYRRLMDNKVTPNVPIMVNTYYPPNSPTAMRCYKFGKAIRQAVEAWDSDKTVGIFASGGLSHTVIEEDLDNRIIEGLREDNVEKLTDYTDTRFRGGTSEIKNWIALGGAMSGSGLQMEMVDYVPCYRTEAGNGCAMGFARWG